MDILELCWIIKLFNDTIHALEVSYVVLSRIGSKCQEKEPTTWSSPTTLTYGSPDDGGKNLHGNVKNCLPI